MDARIHDWARHPHAAARLGRARRPRLQRAVPVARGGLRRPDSAEDGRHHAHEKERGDESPLVVYSNGQAVFRDVVADRLQTITYNAGYAERLAIQVEDGADAARVEVNPLRNFGQPTLAGTGVRVSDIVGRLHAGESARSVAADYEIPEPAVRSLLPMAA